MATWLVTLVTDLRIIRQGKPCRLGWVCTSNRASSCSQSSCCLGGGSHSLKIIAMLRDLAVTCGSGKHLPGVACRKRATVPEDLHSPVFRFHGPVAWRLPCSNFPH